MTQAAAMARRFPSFLPVEGNLKGRLKINDHLSEAYLDIFFYWAARSAPGNGIFIAFLS
jgi:hypothetical protein